MPGEGHIIKVISESGDKPEVDLRSPEWRPVLSPLQHMGGGIASLDPSRAETGSTDLSSKFSITFPGPSLWLPYYLLLPSTHQKEMDLGV